VRKTLLVLAVALLASAAPAAQAHPPDTNATYFNNAALRAADPYVLHDPRSGYYYAYSTEGADQGSYFAIYRSADLATWEKLPGGALPVDDPKQWGNDWFWAPEVYFNPRTRLYYLFYAARSDANKASWFGYASFEEPCKIGVAVSRSPGGPFHNIADHPIDYNPYDPAYHDVNLLMGPDQKKPPATLAEGETAPLGTYIPTIDPDVFFDDNGRIYLYFSRNAYRNWVWDSDLGKYIEESNIYAVELTGSWWNDPAGATMPTIAPRFRGANAGPGGPSGPRRDGYVRILDYDHDKQAWENADVNDYATSGGDKKDRRWEEGSSTLERSGPGGKAVYYVTYSANNWETPQYGVGYATAAGPLGPFRKSPTNPILSQNMQVGMYSTGHGGFAASPDGRQLYYVHHGRPSPNDPQRRLYTERAVISPTSLDQWGAPTLSIDQATSDRSIPSGVAPYALRASARSLMLRSGSTKRITWRVDSADGAALALANPLNRVRATLAGSGVATLQASDDGATVSGLRPGRTTLTLTYQREHANGTYVDVRDSRRPVAVRVPVTVRPTRKGSHG
jgi:GH43 family beta-xylosidase